MTAQTVRSVLPCSPTLIFRGEHVHRLRGVTLEAEEYGLRRAVPVPGGPERPEHLGPNRGHVIVSGQMAGEEAGRPHRSHGVRAGRADADGEQIEDGDVLLRAHDALLCASTAGGSRRTWLRERGCPRFSGGQSQTLDIGFLRAATAGSSCRR
jgi:hypothetical protein